MGFVQRTIACGRLRTEHTGQQVVLNGWAHRVRDLGGVFFVDLRDREGLVQLTFDPNLFPHRSEIRHECCLSVTGEVRERSPETKNPRMATGDIEVVVVSYAVLGPAKPLPFPVSDEEAMQSVNEELRVRHRYLDLRRPIMHRRLAIRAASMRHARSFLDAQGFLEIETPIITKSTPEGARDYLVPYRQGPGKWYALPQSPQQYKQLLMVSGVERYYQVARCFRDEASRADRQPEFTQLDVEMSFVHQEDVMHLAEELTRTVTNRLISDFEIDKEPVGAFDRLTYDEAMHLYGCDKPDIRFGLQLFDATELFRESEFGVFRGAIEAGGFVRGVRYPGGAKLSRKDVGVLEEFVKEFGAKGLGTLYLEQPRRGSISKFVDPGTDAELLRLAQAEEGDVLLFIADEYSAANNILYRLRLEIGDRLGLRDPRILKYLWVVDFPLVEWSAEANRWTATHHPFTMPREEDLVYFSTDPARIRAQAYDIVCNGTEAAGGSIRIHQSDIQARLFSLLGISAESQQDRFGHILEAFSYGAPPHGGIAWGLDRFAMQLTDTENIREVMAFPKVAAGYDPLMDAPSTIDAEQWAELGLRLS
jgi:aspartyl-tRNA synthetase